ncbi:tRNA pseudouridine(13) synthase TruD [Vulgatibacter incomptus]|uniref:tRNA pseudouridine 13 synthase n=1 Tax=Vulgatibacter incomptus TaxID=1391653 RepID=A0A0K1PA60_9BACT|nr:tRNA pseudouridine(13) synthase TruD [Vulgatibacter incomptus]AKU90423.1 tRNA pseudouridine 13 synthase [Vulgatibacter incomptus]
MKLKQRPEDFVVREAYRIDFDPKGPHRVYLMDKQKLSTFEAVQRIATRMRVPQKAISFCGLKDKQGRTEQLVAVRGKDAEMQEPDLRLKYLGRIAEPLSARHLTANRFAITVRDLSEEDVARLAASVADVRRVGVVNYFDSQRFGALKHGQGFIAKDLIRGNTEHALYNYMAKPSPLDQSEDAKVKKFWAEHWGDWDRHCPHKAVARYRNVLVHLREYPDDWAGAFLEIEPRYRALLLFEYQSWLWNEGVRRLLQGLIDERELISLRYQAGRLLFPREIGGDVLRDLRDRDFPLLAPDSEYDDEETRHAVEETLQRERLSLRDLELTRLPGMFFKHEERPLIIYPGKLVVSEPRPDEMNRGRLRVNVAFTLPPGAYATLVTKRLFWFAMLEEEAREHGGELHPIALEMLSQAYGGPSLELAPKPKRPKAATATATAASPAPASAAGAPAGEPKAPTPKPAKLGFREQQRLKKAAKAEARVASEARKEAQRDAAKKTAVKKPVKKKARAAKE